MQGLKQAIQQIFSDEEIRINSAAVSPTPFDTVLLPKRGIAIQLLEINNKLITAAGGHHVSQWADAVEQQSLRPLQIWEDYWHTKQEIVLSQLTSLAGASQKIFARNTVIKRITKPVADDFLTLYHLGGSPSARYKYGLFMKKSGEMVGAATFSPPRKFYREGSQYRSFELIRYAGVNGANITGGLSKVIKAFIDDVQPDDIMTYADRNWWTGSSYLPLGFKLIENTPPQAFWVKPGEWVRFTENNKPEGDGYIKIENAGNRKFLLRLK